jgi:hypothetical protein
MEYGKKITPSASLQLIQKATDFIQLPPAPLELIIPLQEIKK